MHARIVTFQLDGPSPDEYRAMAASIADAFKEWPGLVFKLWLGDIEHNRFGGIYLFQTAADADRSRTTPEFASLEANPAFAELMIDEFPILDEPTAITAATLLHPAA
jgi:hypothetical protein